MPGAPGRTPLASQLALLCFVLLAPIALLAAALTHAHVDAERDALRRQAMDQARGVAVRVEQQMARRIAALQVLAEAPALDPPDPLVMAPQLEAVGRLLGGAVTLRPPGGTPALALRPAAAQVATQPPTAPLSAAPLLAAPLPAATLAGIAAVEEAVLRDQQPSLSVLLQLPGSAEFCVLLAVPVLRQGELRALLWLQLRPEVFRTTLASRALPTGWVASLIDPEGQVLARTQRHAEFLGHRLPDAALANLPAPSGLRSVQGLDGQAVMLAYTVSQMAGWRAAVAVPTALTETALQQSLLLLGLAAAALVVLAAALAAVFARRIARPVRALTLAAQALGRGEPVIAPPAPIEELHAVGAALAAASITLRGRERALAESEARLARALKAARIATWEWEAATDSLTGSRGREALYGRVAGSLSDGASLLASVHPEDRERVAGANRAALEPVGHGLVEVVFRTVWPDGRIRWLQSQGAVMERDSHGTPLRLSGVVMDVTETHAAVEREKLLVSEVDHRARNVLTVVQSLLRMSRSDDPAHFAEAVQGRVGALARAHTLLARERWDGSELFALAREALSSHLDSGHVLLRGQSLSLAPHAVQPLSMVLHELATNAAQHGALSQPQGQVVLSWLVQGGWLNISWAEHHGPAVVAPLRSGFGLRVVENTIRRQLGGSVELQWQADGLVCRLRIATERLLRGETPQGETRYIAGLR